MSEIVAGVRFRRASAKAYVAFSALTAMSEAATIPLPPARNVAVQRGWATGLSSVTIGPLH